MSHVVTRPTAAAPSVARPQDDAPTAGAPGGTKVPSPDSVPAALTPLFEAIFGGAPPVRFEFWDDSALGPATAHVARVNSPMALRRMVWAPGELGLARAFVAGEVGVDGPLAEVLRAVQQAAPDHFERRSLIPAIVSAARAIESFARPPDRLPEEMVRRGVRHTIRRDRSAVRHHYDIGNDFYGLLLGPSWTYSCARFSTPETTLTEAQASKHELICRKLGLHDAAFRRASSSPRPRLLDVGCGWGSMAIHAARHHDVDVVGVTISDSQAELARRRVADAGLTDRIQIRIQDYREVDDGPFDAISSIGMAEHVGAKNMRRYFTCLAGLLRPQGRLLNHAIASIGGSRISPRSFVGRFVFPDGELLDLADTVQAMHGVGFEVRDVENLREHYARTLRAWVAHLEAGWDTAVELVGERRARIWLLYMSGSINGFDDGGLQLFQTLGIKSDGRPSDLPPTRADWG